MAANSRLDPLLNQLGCQNRARVKTDTGNLINQTRTLVPKVGNLTHNNGAVSKVLILDGTIPILYQSVRYNIPVELFLSASYPNEAPKIYVRPTESMTIKQNHKHVDMQGMVYLPYLHEWTTKSTLIGLVELASNVFSYDPPLYSRPPQPVAAQTYTHPQAGTHPTATSGAYQTATVTTAVAQTSIPAAAAVQSKSSSSSSNPQTHNFPSYTQPNPANYSSNAYDGQQNMNRPPTQQNSMTADMVKQALIQEVQIKILATVHNTLNGLKDNINREFNNEHYLDDSYKSATKREVEAKAQIEQYKLALAYIDSKSEEADKWASEERLKPAVDINMKVTGSDDRSEQILKLYAELNAIEDVFYKLERALVSERNETVDLRTYLKEVRELSRRQFQLRAHLMKINADPKSHDS